MANRKTGKSLQKNRKIKKLRKITPTFKQRIAIQKLVEIGGKLKGKQKNITIGRVLKEAGYSPAVQKTPQKVTESKGWKLLMDEYYPDDKLAKAEQGQLGASKVGHYIFPAKESNKEIKEIVESFPNCKLIKIRKQLNWKRAYFSSPDNQAIAKSLDRIYKLKDKYPAEKHKIEEEVKVIKVIQYVRAKDKKG